MNAVRRWPAAGRRCPADLRTVKETRPTAVCVGADPVRAARCEQLVIIYLDHVTWFGECGLRTAGAPGSKLESRAMKALHIQKRKEE